MQSSRIKSPSVNESAKREAERKKIYFSFPKHLRLVFIWLTTTWPRMQVEMHPFNKLEMAAHAHGVKFLLLKRAGKRRPLFRRGIRWIHDREGGVRSKLSNLLRFPSSSQEANFRVKWVKLAALSVSGQEVSNAV